jgi:lipopolysaccharide export system permease protein
MTLYLSPLSLQLWRALVTDVRGDVLTSILREGEFITLDSGLVFELRNRKPDGQLQGIFMSDSREKDVTATYLAERGAVLDSPAGVFLVMNDGTIQRRKRSDGTISIIEFTSYAFDLSTFSSKTAVPAFRPQERDTTYLIHPDPEDRLYQQFPGKFRAELHSRLTVPLLGLLYALIPVVFLGQAESTRQRRSATLTMMLGTAALFGVSSFVLSGLSETSTIALAGMYLVPLGGIAFGIFLVLKGLQPRPPEGVVVIIDTIVARVAGLFRRTPAAAAT